jgi:hypothetical protein
MAFSVLGWFENAGLTSFVPGVGWNQIFISSLPGD